MKKKITIYTSKTCGYCKQVKERFNKENIEFIEKTNKEFQGEWYKISHLTQIPVFPTIVIGNEYLVAGRDFQNPEQAINLVDYIIGPEYKEWPNELILNERIKTLNYSINNRFNQLNEILKQIKEKENEH
tara:strand:- start:461 stop:850 length:390 start_codon:yes stop_codon:yes gene_type:complete